MTPEPGPGPVSEPLACTPGSGSGVTTWQADVQAFHEALDIPVGETPAIRRPELRAELIREEAAETVAAIERGDLVEAIDGLCDVIVVVLGTAVEFGIDLQPFWDEVHRTNMAKVGGPVREDGKRLKPEGWTPPDIPRLLRQQNVPYPFCIDPDDCRGLTSCPRARSCSE